MSRGGGGDLRRTFALFRRFAVGQRRAFVFAAILLTAEAGSAVLVVNVLGELLNFLNGRRAALSFAPSHTATIALFAAALVGLTAVNSLADSLAEISLARAGRTIGYNLRVALFGHLQRLSLAFHLRRRTGDVLTRITGDVAELEEFIVASVSDLSGSFLLLAASLIALYGHSLPVTLLAAAMVPILAFVSSSFASRIKAAAKQLRAREGDLASAAQEMLTSISVVQAYGRSGHEQRRFAVQSRATMAALMRTARLEAAFSFTVSVLEALVIAGVIWVGAVVIGEQRLPPGTLVACILLIQNMFKPTRRIIKEWNTVGKIYASVERIADLLAREPAVQDTADAVDAPRLAGAIEFREVSFVYQAAPDGTPEAAPTRLNLDGISFTVTPGEVVALVGHSGAGKSTIAQLLPRLYDPHAGAVFIDGHDIRDFTIESLRSQISMVLQETVLFSGTVLENIRYGREDASLEDVMAAAEQANAHDFIMAMPEGYDTVLGERAGTLSGGQRQRLAIARAFVRDAPILVLDEPTTGLDAESSEFVRKALHKLVRGKTTLIVSHDFNLIRDADRILGISAGRILEEGTPADLLARGGLYAELHALQFGGRGGGRTDAPAQVPAGMGEPVPVTAGGRAHAEADYDGDGMAIAGRRRAFETALMEAVPLPASPEAFRLLTGRAAPLVVRALAGTDLDPLRTPGLRNALPGLAEALDATAMTPALQRLLADGWALEWCSPGKVLIEPGEGATLRYRVGLRHAASGEIAEHLIAGRMFESRDCADEWMRQQLSPLAERAAGRADLSAFARAVDHIEPLGLVLHAFPLDPDLPGLLDATDPARLAETVGAALAGAIPDLVFDSCRPQVVQYARRGRCVLRYEVTWRLGATGRKVKQVVYGKVYSDDTGTLVGPAIAAVGAHTAPRTDPPARVLIPAFQGYVPELHLALLQALPGAPQVSVLVRDRVAGNAPADGSLLTLEFALHTCAGIAATLHRSDAEIGTARTLSGDIEAARSEVTAIAGLAPSVAETLDAHLRDAEAAVGDEPMPQRLAHGDFTPAQILFDGPLSGLIDLDTACRAEPALDLGQFAGYVSLARRKAEMSLGRSIHPSDDPGPAFLDDYCRVAGIVDSERLAARVAAYRTVALIRVAARSWRQLKTSRLRLAIDLLDEQRVPEHRIRP